MDVIEYLKTEERICGFYTEGCQECPLSSYNNGAGTGCGRFIKQEPEKCIEIMKKWTEEHPQKTIVQELLEKCPDAPINGRGYPGNICPDNLGYSRYEKCPSVGVGDICVDCWNRPLEEAKVKGGAEFKPKEPELKACPFCGGEAAVTGRWREYAIECVECPTMTTYYKTPEEAVEAWNRRAEEHSVRTRQSEFLKMFPNASLDSNGSVDICPKATDLVTFSCDDGAHGGCLRCRQRYWQQEVKDEPLD